MSRLAKLAKSRSATFDADTSDGEKLKEKLRRSPTDGAKWTFSFRFFREIEFFALNGEKVDHAWFLSVLDRLRSLGELEIDSVLRDYSVANSYRFHPINWAAKNIPVNKSDLDWISQDYRDNDDEFPLMQFMISTGKGRIIGFFDENNVFQLVLLDPLHNMQPSKAFGYAVDPSSPLGCEFTRFHNSVSAVAKSAKECECGLAEQVQDVLNSNGFDEKYSVLTMRIDDQGALQDAEDLIKDGKATGFSDIFQAGLYAVLERELT